MKKVILYFFIILLTCSTFRYFLNTSAENEKLSTMRFIEYVTDLKTAPLNDIFIHIDADWGVFNFVRNLFNGLTDILSVIINSTYIMFSLIIQLFRFIFIY